MTYIRIMYIQKLKHLQQYLYCEVGVMVELSAVYHHHAAMAMCSQTGDMCFQRVTTSHRLGVGDDVGDICFILIHPIYDEAEVF